MLTTSLLEHLQNIFSAPIEHKHSEFSYGQAIVDIIKQSKSDLSQFETSILENLATITTHDIRKGEMPLHNMKMWSFSTIKERDISTLIPIVESINSVWLTAKLYDFAWSTLELRTTEYAQAAIDAYIQFPADNMIMEIGYWIRALSIAKWTKNTDYENNIIRTLVKAASSGNSAFIVTRDLMSHSFKSIHPYAKELAALVYEEAQKEQEHGFAIRKIQLLIEMANRRVQLKQSKDDLLYEQATIYTLWAEDTYTSNMPPAAADKYRNALELLELISKQYHLYSDVQQKIKEIEKKLVTLREDTKAFFAKTAHTYNIDLSDIAESTREFVRGQPFNYIAGLNFPHKYQIRQKNYESLKNGGSFLNAFFGNKVHYDENGLLVGSYSSDTPEGKYLDLIKTYQEYCGIFTRGQVLPALSLLKQQESLEKSYFDTLSDNCLLIPENQKQLASKALWYGYQEDFSTAIMLICPLIESCLRYTLKECGVPTVTISKATEGEKSLTLLLKLGMESKIFDSLLKFEIEALFSSKQGYNLRNKVAHGLVDDYSSQADSSVMAWWWFLRAVIFYQGVVIKG